VEKIVHNMALSEFRQFREMAIDGLLEATFYEYLYLGCPFDEAERLKVSLRRALARWWDSQHIRVARPRLRSLCTQCAPNATRKRAVQRLVSASRTPDKGGR
jgi:hypothetical protein